MDRKTVWCCRQALVDRISEKHNSLRLRSCRLTGAFVISPLPPFFDSDCLCSKAPSLRGRYPVSALLRAWPPPSRLRSLSRFCRLYGLPCSPDFSVGRGRLLQLLDLSLPPCCPYHPAEVTRRLGQSAPCHTAFALP